MFNIYMNSAKNTSNFFINQYFFYRILNLKLFLDNNTKI